MNVVPIVTRVASILLPVCVWSLWSAATLGQALNEPTQTAIEAAIAIDEPESKAAVRELVSSLNDDAVRALLIQRLDAVAEAKEQTALEGGGVLGVLRKGISAFWQNATYSVANTHKLPDIGEKINATIQRVLAPDGYASWFLVVLLAIAIGVCAERLVAYCFREPKRRLIEAYSTTLSGILKILYTRLSFDILGVLAFWLASYLTISAYHSHSPITLQLGYVVTISVVATWMGYVICRFYFAPRRPDLRICKTTDQRAMQLTLSLSLLAGFIVLMHNCFYLFLQIGDADYGGFPYMVPLGFYMNLSLYVVAVGVVWYNRAGLSEVLIENKKRVSLAIGEDAPEDLSWFATYWPQIAIGLIAAKYFLVEVVVNTADVGVYSPLAVYITFIVIFLWPGIDANVSLLVAKGIHTPDDETESASKARRSMQQGLLRVGRVMVVGVVLYALAWLWGVNILHLAEAGLGAQVAGTLIEFLLLALFAYIAWELVSIFIGYWLAAEGGDPNDQEQEVGGDAGGVGLSRVATVLPIVRKTAQFLIVTVFIIMMLDNWGVNIGPILAGAGVVGLAIGFGAQTLVKDIVSGLFFLADDAFRVGEYIDVGGTMGNVEKISLRSLRLRHHRGLVHTIPYGEIPKLTNFSRDWVIMKLRFRVPFETDINKVKKIFKKIGNDLVNDPVLGEDFLQPFKSQGVAEVDDNGMVVRGKFMAKPGKQFMIRKEVYVRVQKAFEEAGIPFARKQVLVHIPGLDQGEQKTLSDDDVRTVAAAAADTIDEPPQSKGDKQPT